MKHGRKPKAVVVGVISKVLKILEVIQGSPSGLTLKVINDLTGINKSTAHRFLMHLKREGYLTRVETGAYMIGPKLFQMSAQINHRAALQAISRPVLWELSKATRETVNLAVLDEATVVYLEVLESPHEFRLVSRVGMRRPVYSTALGKALVAFIPEEQRESVLNSINFSPLTPRTITTLAQFKRELEIIPRQGYSLDNEESVVGARCVGAPILNAKQQAVAAISVAGPITRISEDKVPAIAAAVVESAQEISVRIGFSRPRLAEKMESPRQEVSPV